MQMITVEMAAIGGFGLEHYCILKNEDMQFFSCFNPDRHINPALCLWYENHQTKIIKDLLFCLCADAVDTLSTRVQYISRTDVSRSFSSSILYIVFSLFPPPCANNGPIILVCSCNTIFKFTPKLHKEHSQYQGDGIRVHICGWGNSINLFSCIQASSLMHYAMPANHTDEEKSQRFFRISLRKAVAVALWN